MNLLSLKPEGKLVFVGDTHGDLDARVKVIEKYFKSDTRIGFLGDYVDRGPFSRENIDYLLEKRNKNPDRIFLLQGNHENYNIFPFNPADFWYKLSWEDYKKYSEIFKDMPLVLSIDGIIALHGALPDIQNMSEINNIPQNQDNRNWKAIIWGDFEDKPYSFDYEMDGRPTYNKKYFDKVMNRLGKNVLIRSHQINIKSKIFDNRCLTVFTSSAYSTYDVKRTIAIADFNKNKEIKTIDDLIVEEI
ncbi:MAG: serine/threonine protein phosphatase [Nanoarchaeota archaeon]|nr:serine/threonine protein phosphatase [Nanoarchaeota archaeon]MBU4116980.1 serine/threonine protein phosphatase [Nanoarchaeota archaeon]